MKPSELLSGPDRWLQGPSACRADGTTCGIADPDAVRFCMGAAMIRCGFEYRSPEWERLDAACRALGHASIVGMNNAWRSMHSRDASQPHTSFEDVRAVLLSVGL